MSPEPPPNSNSGRDIPFNAESMLYVEEATSPAYPPVATTHPAI